MKIFPARFSLPVAVAALALIGFPRSLSAQTLTKIIDNGSNATHVNLVFLSEGYTSAELTSKFPQDARTVVDALFQASPYNEYRSYFNVYTIAVASNESGSDHYTPTVVLKDTYFNSTYDSYGTQRVISIPPNDRDGNYADGRGKVDALLMNLLPDYSQANVIVNDSVYGGAGGAVSVFSTNAASGEIFIHEMGHSFGKLGDEYGTPYAGYPDIEEPNTTTQTDRALIKWAAWILPRTPVPTPDTSNYSAVDGLFEGAHYHDTGWYRPKQNCRMRTLGQPFCEICTEDLVLTTYRTVRPIESFSPATLNFSAASGAALTFSVARKTPATHTLFAQWSVDGVAASGQTGNQFSPAALSVGSHTVSVTVNDPTPLVRTDPNRVLTDSKTWTVQITDGGAATHPAFFSGEVALTNGVYYLQFPSGNPFGYYSYLSDPNYIYHFDLGYEYVFDAADGKSGVYLYDFASSTFFYTSPAFPFPYLYDFSLNTVLYYYPDPVNAGRYNTNGVRYFYRFDTGQIFGK